MQELLSTMRIYTLGYQGLSAVSYIKILRASYVGVVLDVRENAWSYRPEFVKSPLEQALRKASIDYLHIRSAGNPSENRRTASSADECLSRYREYLYGNPQCIGELYSYIRMAYERGRPACLTCYERAQHQCHRSILIEFLKELEPAIEPVHLPLEIRPLTKPQSLLKTSFVGPRFLPTT